MSSICWSFPLGVVIGLGLVGCRSAPEPVAFQNRTFYEYGQLSSSRLADFERHYPPLDLAQSAPRPNFLGVEVLGGTARFSRPDQWVIRDASNDPEQRFIEYVSPREVIFSIYERVESPTEPWQVLMERYEKQAADSGAKLLSKAFPLATWNAQARGYVVERGVPAPKQAFMSHCREYLVRSEHRVLLVQIVHQGDSVQPVEDEVLRAFTSLQVL